MASFLSAIEQVHIAQLRAPAYASESPEMYRSAIEHMLANPFYHVGAGRRDVAQVERQVRRMYLVQNWSVRPFLPGFDWLSILDWITANWDKILRVILALLPFLFLDSDFYHYG